MSEWARPVAKGQQSIVDIFRSLEFSRREWAHFAFQFAVLAVPVALTLTGGLDAQATVLLFVIEAQLALVLTHRLRAHHRDGSRKLGYYLDSQGRLPATRALHPRYDWHAMGVGAALALSVFVLLFTFVAAVMSALSTDSSFSINRQFAIALGWVVGLTMAEWGYDRHRAARQPYLWMRNRSRAAFARLGVMCFFLIGAFVLFSGPVMAYVGLLVFVALRALTEVVLINAREAAPGDLPLWLRLLHSDQADGDRDAEFERWRAGAEGRERFGSLAEMTVPAELFSAGDEAVVAWSQESAVPIQVPDAPR